MSLNFKKLYESAILSEGAWGYGTDQNDQALDLFDEIFRTKEIISRLEKRLKKVPKDAETAWENVCLADLTKQAFDSAAGFGKHLFKFEYAQTALKNLEVCERDTAWQNEWDKPEELRKELEALKKRFQETKPS